MNSALMTLTLTLGLGLAIGSTAGAGTLNASNEKDLHTAANVDSVVIIENEQAKLFSISGGDPAMNGTFLNLAIQEFSGSSWIVYELANVRDFKLLGSVKKGFLKVQLVRDTMDSDGNISLAKSILFINLTGAKQGSIKTTEQQ